MDRQPPRATSDDIDLYIRTYYSLLRSSAGIRVRAFEEPHAWSESSLHAGARDAAPDVAAFAYSAARLPDCMPSVKWLVMGQSKEQFESVGIHVRDWPRVRTRGRRRPMRWNGNDTLACFITSTSDIDDLVPIITAYQIEWNKLHRVLSSGERLDDHVLATLHDVFGTRFTSEIDRIKKAPLDLATRLLSGSFVEYQRAAQRWWGEIERVYVDGGQRRPVYFVSSNTHSLVNLLGGYALAHGDLLRDFVQRENPEELAPELAAAVEGGNEIEIANHLYYVLRVYLRDDPEGHRMAAVQAFDAQSGITNIPSPGHIDVNAQIIEVAKLKPERLDPRLRQAGLERLAASDAVIINIDYPLGMAAYHHLSRLAQGVGEIRGVYIMGKAATLNGRVGDVMISGVAYDEHSTNSYLFRNCFDASDVKPHVLESSVLDGQKALTVRGSFLQNRKYMSVFYQEGYTVLEMEAGPYLSAIYEMVYPKRHPKDEIVHLSTLTPFEFGLLHYASDTPYSRRQSLLSKSLSLFGVDSTYGCAATIARRILGNEVARLTP
ncbi:MAG: hypothetical protein KA712_11455 [Myxococcales bacterium]|nr:hypothetical protein [Myxococcales bacterium]